MTLKQKVVELREQFPYESWHALGKRVGLHYDTVRRWLDPDYEKHRRGKIADNTRERMSKRKFILVQFLGGQCSECGYRDNLSVLDFHHKDPTQKIAGVGSLLSSNFEKSLEEAKKCVLLCANCHRKLHEQESDLSSEKSGDTLGWGGKTEEGVGPQILRLNPN